ncbi:MAG: hypothetical protein VZR14_08355, partial [Hallerella sp.]|nr:hypothetical protein [Hallerella sp.]
MKFWKWSALAGLVTSLAYAANSPTVKVDLDMSGRNSSEVTESNYVPWVVSGVSSKDTTLSGVKFTIAKGSAGSELKANWYKAGVQSPNYAKLVCDGVLVNEGSSGGEISLTISGLSAGTHTLLAYLNHVDDLSSTSYSAVDVYVNGTKQTSVTPTMRALSTSASAYAF